MIAPAGAAVPGDHADGSEERRVSGATSLFHDAKSERTKEETVAHRVVWKTLSSTVYAGTKQTVYNAIDVIGPVR
ncbi:hypothetical protein ACIFSR_31155 [Paenibacillus sp. NRS-1760]